MKTRHVMGILTAVCVLMSAAALAVPGAPGFADDGGSYGIWAFSAGTQWLDLSGLNAMLSANGYAAFSGLDAGSDPGTGSGTGAPANGCETFEDHVYSWGFESYYAMGGRFLLGGEFQFFIDETDNETYLQRLSAYWGFFDIGYSVIGKNTGGFHLYPLVGLGGSWMGLRLTARDTLDFSDVVSDPKRESSLSKWDFLGQAALGMHYTFGSKRRKDPGCGGFMLGARAGYQYSFTDSNWKMSDLDVSGDPGVSMSGFFVRFVIGGSDGYPHGDDEHDDKWLY